MRNTNLTYPFNLHPRTLAAMLVEQGNYDQTHISVHPDPKKSSEQIVEITKTTIDWKTGHLTIGTKNQTGERQNLVNGIDAKSPYRDLLHCFESEASQLKTEIFLEERSHTLGASELQTHFFKLPGFLTMEQKKIMAYFLPWASLIKEDIELMERCFFTVIGHPVKIENTNSKCEKLSGPPIDTWITDYNILVSGETPKRNPCYCIKIGPLPNGNLSQFSQGSSKRRFLEEVFFPAFIPEHHDWETIIRVDESDERFEIDTQNGKPTILGVNSKIF